MATTHTHEVSTVGQGPGERDVDDERVFVSLFRSCVGGELETGG